MNVDYRNDSLVCCNWPVASNWYDLSSYRCNDAAINRQFIALTLALSDRWWVETWKWLCSGGPTPRLVGLLDMTSVKASFLVYVYARWRFLISTSHLFMMIIGPGPASPPGCLRCYESHPEAKLVKMRFSFSAKKMNKNQPPYIYWSWRNKKKNILLAAACNQPIISSALHNQYGCDFLLLKVNSRPCKHAVEAIITACFHWSG